MRRRIIVEHLGRRTAVAWLSFQPDGSISCGLSDRTFVSPRFKDRINIWNSYNRITIKYENPSDPNSLVPVINPHFTFHPDAIFQLKGELDRSRKDEDLFKGIADVTIVLEQEVHMPWLRFVSQSLRLLHEAGIQRNDGIASEDILFVAPSIMPAASATIEIDFIRHEDIRPNADYFCHDFVWQKFCIRVRLGVVAPQIATLAWFHSY